MKDDKYIPIIKKNNLDDNMDILIFYNKYMHCVWMMIIIIIIINVVYCHKNLLQLLFANIKLSAMMMNDESKKEKKNGCVALLRSSLIIMLFIIIIIFTAINIKIRFACLNKNDI